ncbi:helix-turn-helix domain-containing protein [Paenibacillus sp. FSL L8-0493]|uniref:helix-turn-helix domain-containing protein n=1 Tax=Paenibacillus sp. FSL L8-0493 TaxID=2975333 RepID=UPI0030FDE90D
MSEEFKDRLKLLRNAKGLTSEELAMATDIPHSSIRRMESQNDIPRPDRLNILANYFNVSTDYLLGRQVKESEPKSLPEEVILKVISQAEEDFGVSLRDDPVVEAAVRDLIRNLAKMKKSTQKGD